MMRVLLLLVVLGVGVSAQPWGEGVVLKATQQRELPGGGVLQVVSAGSKVAVIRVGEVTRELAVGESQEFGDYRVALHTLTEGRCRLHWARTPPAERAQALLASYGWKAVGAPQELEFAIPAELGGPAFTGYQSSSQEIGMDLRLAAGQKCILRKYRLSQDTGSGYALYAYLAVQGTRLVGAWLASEAPIAPGIAALSSRQPLRW